MPELTIKNSLDEGIVDGRPDVLLLHALTSMPEAPYGVLTYSVSKASQSISEVLAMLDELDAVDTLSSSKETAEGFSLSSLHTEADLAVKKRELTLRIENRLDQLHAQLNQWLLNNPPHNKLVWREAKQKLVTYYTSVDNAPTEARRQVYAQSLRDRSYVQGGVGLSRSLVTTESQPAAITSVSIPALTFDGSPLELVVDGSPVTVPMPTTTQGQLVYTGGPWYSHAGLAATTVAVNPGLFDIVLVNTGTASQSGNIVSFSGVDVLASGVQAGDSLHVPAGDAIITAVLSTTQVQVDTPYTYSGVAYEIWAAPVITVLVDGEPQDWNVPYGPADAATISAFLMGQTPPFTALPGGGGLTFVGGIGGTHTIQALGRVAALYGFPTTAGVGEDETRTVQFTVDGTPVTVILPISLFAPLSVNDVYNAMIPPSGPYSVTTDGIDITITTDGRGGAHYIQWEKGLGIAPGMYTGTDITIKEVLASLQAGGINARGTNTQEVEIQATESLEAAVGNPLGLPTAAAYGLRLAVSYDGQQALDEWEMDGQTYVWDGERVQPPMPYSSSGNITAYIGGAMSWGKVLGCLEQLLEDGKWLPVRVDTRARPRIRTFLASLTDGLNQYSRPVYPEISALLEGLEEGKHRKTLQALEVFDMFGATSLAMSGRAGSEGAEDPLPTLDEPTTPRIGKTLNISSPEEADDEYFELGRDPDIIEVPESRIRYD